MTDRVSDERLRELITIADIDGTIVGCTPAKDNAIALHELAALRAAPVSEERDIHATALEIISGNHPDLPTEEHETLTGAARLLRAPQSKPKGGDAVNAGALGTADHSNDANAVTGAAHPQPRGEPVAEVIGFAGGLGREPVFLPRKDAPIGTLLYAAPQQQAEPKHQTPENTAQQQVEPGGFVLAPIKVTDEMVLAYRKATEGLITPDAHGVIGYRAMLAVARTAMPSPWQAVRELVDEQAEDDGLWFEAKTAPEGYLQQQLRLLHELVERAAPPPDSEAVALLQKAYNELVVDEEGSPEYRLAANALVVEIRAYLSRKDQR